MNDLTDENFEKELTESEKPVLVDFFADWCPPCSILAPILEKVAEDLGGKFILVKVNVDTIPLTAKNFKIEKIPTVALFKNGKPVSGFVGVQQEPAIKEWLEKELKE
ncbi:MAG: thioredoxin [bacterium]|nr:thioredoxin [bacterium]